MAKKNRGETRKTYDPFWDDDNCDICCGFCESVLELFPGFKKGNMQCAGCGQRTNERELDKLSKEHWDGRWFDVQKLCVELNITSYVVGEQRFRWNDDTDRLERCFPGCSAAWDKNPLTREFGPHYLRVSIAYRDMHDIRLQAFKTNIDGMLIREIDHTKQHPMGMGRPTVAYYSSEGESWVIIR